jgi:glycosyltransferase involved in cell wall biosynthesis
MSIQTLHRAKGAVEPAAPRAVPLLANDHETSPKPRARAALVGTFAPRKCGIATFTTDIFEQLSRYEPDIAIDVYALDRGGTEIRYERARSIIDVDDAGSFERAAGQINASGADCAWIQHEFGIFGAEDGEAVCDFVDRIALPLIFTFHTVLTDPSTRQHRIMRHLITRASRIMVMSEHGRELLIEHYGASADLVEVIAHGAPDRPFGRQEAFKAALGLAERDVMMTFGLLGPGKGLECMIEALPAIIARHPRAVYRIVGATHPDLVAREGEAYRARLQAQARTLGVEDHIVWEDRFLDCDELLDQLEACDVYVTPYPNLQQSTSGTLSYAVALGKAVVSTPYVHARELLAGGAGVIVEPNSSAALAAAVIDLLGDRSRLTQVQRQAYAKGRATIWPQFASASAALVRSAVRPREAPIPSGATPSLAGVFAMTDGTGMLQHAVGIVPDRHHGYCLDDNARALMLMNIAPLSEDDRAARSATYASFVQHAWNPAQRRFRNFMNFDRTWCEDIGSEDSNGRALWALGHTVERAPNADLRWWAQHWFNETAPALLELSAPRARAFAMLGAAAVLRAAGSHPIAQRLLGDGGDLLSRLIAGSRRPDWAWFEAMLGYDNPRLSQALIEAGMACGRSDWIASGIESLHWIAKQQGAGGDHFRPVGSETFGHAHALLPFDQQPLEAQAAIEASASAFAATGDNTWLGHAQMAYRWFFGGNDRGVVLADYSNGRCRDGVTPRGANENCGAESILAFQLSHLCNVASRAEVARTEATSDFDAITSFRERLARQADQEEYLVTRSDGAPIAHFIRTVAGQWYAIARAGAASN